MQIINYINLDHISEAASELKAEITVTDHSHSFRIFKGRNCTHLHICSFVNIKEKPTQLLKKSTDRFL